MTTAIALPRTAPLPRTKAARIAAAPATAAQQAERLLIALAAERYRIAADAFGQIEAAFQASAEADEALGHFAGLASLQMLGAEADLLDALLAGQHAADPEAAQGYHHTDHRPRSFEYAGQLFSATQDPDAQGMILRVTDAPPARHQARSRRTRRD